MNTKLSDKKVADFIQNQTGMKRKVQTFSGTFEAQPKAIFPLLCPSREIDWIPGWDCELIYTSNGYAEPECVFTTNESNVTGDGVWVFSDYQPNKLVKIVRFMGDTVYTLTLTLDENEDGTTTVTWNIITTALNDNGNAMVEKMPDKSPLSDGLIKALDHYLRTGELLKPPGHFTH